MSDETKNTLGPTKEYVVVFDRLDANTGEFSSGGPGHAPVALTTAHVRGDKVSLNAEDAKRHLESGAVIEASDKRAKLIQPNPVNEVGVRRDPQITGLPLEEVATPVAGGEGATRTTGKGGKLGTKAELEKLPVGELKALAAAHGVEVVRGDTRPKLAAKLARVKVADAGAGADETVNPGQGKDESAPPEHQPDEPPDAS